MRGGMVALNSTSIVSADYAAEAQELTLQFQSGRSYTYYGVPAEVYDGLLMAGSPGAYFNTAIKNQYG